jgi:hypothetical protein
MRVTVSHDKNPQEIISSVDRGFDDMMRGLPLGPIQFIDETRSWNGPRMDFAFTAKAGLLNVPIKGFVLVEQRQVTIDVDLPPLLSSFIPEQKLKTAVETQARALLGPASSSSPRKS